MRLKLTNVRIAFCQDLFKPGTFGGDPSAKPTHSATFLIPKNDAQVSVIERAMAEVAKEKWDKKADKVLEDLKKQDKVCLRDGDMKDKYDGFADCFYIKANSPTKPGIFDKLLEPISEQSGIVYAGCYVNASVDIYAQDNKWGRRINASLRGVQKAKDGDAFAAGAPASADEFESIDDTGDNDDLV